MCVCKIGYHMYCVLKPVKQNLKKGLKTLLTQYFANCVNSVPHIFNY